MESARRWDIFCTVIDNYGDIGVCWRLARQLVAEHGVQANLWVDDLVPFVRLCPQASTTAAVQIIEDVKVSRWTPALIEAALGRQAAEGSADCVIEAFGCALPADYAAAMSAGPQRPVWINLEYLSAEDWIEGVHGLASPQPGRSPTKYFFFPGFTAGTGGLLKEADYEPRRASFDPAAFRTRFGLPPERHEEITISLFGYDNTALPGLLDAWSHSERPIRCLVPEGRMVPEIQRFFGHRDRTLHRGHLTAHVIPFLPQRDYDQLLWLCDLNFVRGEDSFVRAQWAAKPFVWHIYPQAEAAHQVKLDAFLARYLAALPASIATSTRDFWGAWNDGADAARYWPEFARSLPALSTHALPWSRQISAHGDLTRQLVQFVARKSGK